MNKIKLGNDFVLLWQIKRNGELENLLEAVNIRMVRYINVFGFQGEEIPCIPLDNGIVRVEITPEYAPVVGKYFLELHYELTDLSVADKDRKCRVDMEAFRIVPRTSAMTGAYTMSETSDLLIGLRGEKFVFADFTEEELDDLKQGLDNFVAIAEVQEANRESADQARETRTNSAISEIKSDTVEAIGRVDDAISLSDAATLRANTAASDANESEVIRESQEADRQTNTTNAITATNTATTQANTARDEAVIATSDARDAISDTETATSDANVATGKANTATTQANTARDNANASALNADEKATLAETAAQNANNATSDFSDAELIREQQEEARQTNTATAITNAENAIVDVNTAKDDYYDVVKPVIQAQGVYAQEQGDYAKAQGEAIQDDLALKANHGYESNPKTLKEVDDNLAQLESDVEQLAYVKIKNETVNGNFENGLIAPFRSSDGSVGESTLTINSSTPISGNYDIRLTITTPSTIAGRPHLVGLDKAGNIGDKIYLHFYAKILSGIPTIHGIHNGAGAPSIYDGDVINGRNTRIIDVAGTGNTVGRIYFNSESVWDMQMDNFMRINLTETFGAGNEPTKEGMDLLISTLGTDYFEGETTIPAQKIWQKQIKIQDDLAQLAGDLSDYAKKIEVNETYIKKDYLLETGKNLFNINSENNVLGSMINSENGHTEPSEVYNATHFISVDENTIYSLSHNSKYFAWYDKDMNFLLGNNESVNVITSPPLARYARFSIIPLYWDNFQVEKGTVSTSYEPYEISLKTKFKDNITSDIDWFINDDGYPNNSDGNINSSNGYKRTNFLKLPEKIEYSLQVRLSVSAIAFYDKDKVYISSIDSNNASEYTIVSDTITREDYPENAYYFIASTYRTYSPTLIFNLPDIIPEENKNLGDTYIPLPKSDIIYASHFSGVMGTDRNNPVIPEMSIWSLQVAKRMGFKYVQCNAALTSDGQRIMQHDIPMRTTMTDLSGNLLDASVLSTDLTLEYIKNNFKYKSTIPKFRTKILEMKEYLRICREYGIIPLFNNTTFSEAEYDSIVDIVGNKFGIFSSVRQFPNKKVGHIVHRWVATAETPEDALSRLEEIGQPVIYGAYAYSWTKELSDALQANGYLRNVGSVYNEASWADMKKYADFNVTDVFTNPTENYDSIISSDRNWDDFTTTGEVVDGLMILEIGDTLSYESVDVYWLAKLVLNLTFKGSLKISCGNMNPGNIDGSDSDGKINWIYSRDESDPSIDVTPSVVDGKVKMILTATEKTTIYSTSLKITKV